MNAIKPRRFLDGVTAMDLGAPRIEATLAGHISRRAVFDELANVLDAPSRDAAAELDRGGVAA